jgi:hypothetical protein
VHKVALRSIKDSKQGIGKGCGCCIRRDVRGAGWGEEGRGEKRRFFFRLFSQYPIDPPFLIGRFAVSVRALAAYIFI